MAELIHDLVLTRQEVAILTGHKRKDAQVRELRFMGIEHRLRADGSPVVLRSHLDKMLSG